LEFDIAWKNDFSPYDWRALLEPMLSVAERLGMPPMNATLYERTV
jgi:hypothetical protein